MAWQREPYPAKEKWTQREEQIYAEGRKSAQGEAGSSPSGKRSGRKRYVKTAAGERRYGQPIGTEIGNPRNRKAAEAQQDKESTGRYGELVGADKNAQSQAMRGLNDDQLQRLSRVAYSFKSSDPNVVRLRIGVASELARRGFNVNDFGGLGPKSGGGKPRPAGPPARAAAPRRKPSPYISRKPKPARSAMSARKNDRRLRELSVPQFRQAVQVFSQVPAAKRQAVARVLVRRALELGAPHFLGEAVIEAANLPDETRTTVIELAGRWKHGWIPLDGTAIASKMKGKTGGKRWWDGGAGGSAKGRVRGDGKMRVRGGVGIPKNGGNGRGKMQVSAASERKGGPVAAGTGRVHTSRGTGKATAADLRRGGFGSKESKKAASFQSNETTGGRFAAQKRDDRIPIGNGDEYRKQPDGTYSVYRDGKRSKSPVDNGLSREKAQDMAAQIHKTMAASASQRQTGVGRQKLNVKSAASTSNGTRDAVSSEVGLPGGIGRATPEQLKRAQTKLKTMVDQSRPDPRWDTPQRRAQHQTIKGLLDDVNRALGGGESSKKRPGVKGSKESLRRSIAAGNEARARRESGARKQQGPSKAVLPEGFSNTGATKEQKQAMLEAARRNAGSGRRPGGGRRKAEPHAATGGHKTASGPNSVRADVQRAKEDWDNLGKTDTAKSMREFMDQFKAKPPLQVQKRNTVQPNEAQERDALRALKQRLERVGGDKSRLSPKEREALQRLSAKYPGKA